MSELNNLWDTAISMPTLQSGWHLTRTELAKGFFHDFYHQQAFASAISSQLAEVQRLLQSGTYSPRPLRAISVPKGPMATRPGSNVSIRDRVVLWSLIKTIAPAAYRNLSPNVYSYRLSKRPRKGILFRESNAISLPFLKRTTISAELDPFEAWYALWPDFEARTSEVIGTGYNYLVVSDIAAYFENISLDILKDQLLHLMPSEPIIVNLILDVLKYWTVRSHSGAKPARGIPQGSGIFSFFGNLYLMPVDGKMDVFAKQNDAIYIRYMDDIRIFCKDSGTARRAAFALEDAVRSLHLNLQSSKTKILRENQNRKEITNSLFDKRVDELTSLNRSMRQKKLDATRAKEDLRKISLIKPEVGEKIHRLRTVGTGLTDRALRMWMNSSLQVRDNRFLQTLVFQIRVNPDQRLSQIFVSACKQFPRKTGLGDETLLFLESDQNAHEGHEAELIRGVRYLSSVKDGLWKRALRNTLDGDADFQRRVQSLLLLGMRSHSPQVLHRLFSRLKSDPDIIVHPYYVAPLGQLAADQRAQLIEFFSRHANPHNREFGLLLQDFDEDVGILRVWLDYVFRDDNLLVDWQGLLWFAGNSNRRDIREEVRERVAKRARAGGRQSLRLRLLALRNQIDRYAI